MSGRVTQNNGRGRIGSPFVYPPPAPIGISALCQVLGRGSRPTVLMADRRDVGPRSLLRSPSPSGGNQVFPWRGLEVDCARREPSGVLESL